MSQTPLINPDERASERLQRYLDEFSARLRQRCWWRGAAVVAAAALMVTLAGAFIAVHLGFGHGVLATIRGLLLLALAAAAGWWIARPLRRLRGATYQSIEANGTHFNGRLRTYGETPAAHPLLELLAEDALRLAQQQPVIAHIPRRQLWGPAGVAVIAMALLLWLASAGPALYRDGARAIWAGWLLPNWQPSLRIDVEPGNQAIRRGGEVTIRSRMGGFDPASAQLHARTGSGAWQQVAMQRRAHGFEFTLFSVTEPVHYYVSAAGVRSANYALAVLDVPRIDRLSLVYHYPEWTRKPAQTQDDDGDISALAGTHVDLSIHADGQLTGAELVLNDAGRGLATDGQSGRAGIDVSQDGRYYLALRIGSERVRLSDDFLIKVLPDNKPEVHIVRPGHDYSASSIEEVMTHVQASDDYGLEQLQLRYSVNGGAWQSVALPVSGLSTDAAHVFQLESLRPQHEQRPLAAGDLISYYAIAYDHAQSAQTDLFFIDVQPFDRRYSQSQSMGGGSGGDEQDQISQRQREIVLSTWNLLRQKTESQPAGHAAVSDNAALLAALQTKLAAQAQSLAERTQSRALDSADPKIANFVDSMKRASQAMTPAAQHLSATELEAALAPEQQALQYLMRAEAQFSDMQVAMQRGGGGGNQSARDLSQIYELEMDLKKNQYDSAQRAAPQASELQNDDMARRLQELAQRQQQLAQAAQKSGAFTPQQRWQQQSLQRDAEDLQRQLAAQQQDPAGTGASAQSAGSSAAGGAVSAGGSPGAQDAPSAAGRQSDAPEADSALAKNLQQAIRAMAQAGAGNAVDAESAVRALNDAGTALARSRLRALQRSIDQLAQQADQLYTQQRQTQSQLQSAAHPDPAARATQRASNQAQLADQERQVSAGVQQLGDAIAATAHRYQSDAPSSAQALQQASQTLQESDLKNRLDIAAQYIALGRGADVAPSAAASADALRTLREQLQRAAGVASAASSTASAMRDPVVQELARVRSLRAQLQRLADARVSASASAVNGALQAGGAAAADDGGSGALAEAAQGVGNGAASLLPLLRARGVDTPIVSAIGSLSRQLAHNDLAARGDAISDTLAREIALLEQLDLQLSQHAQPSEPKPIRSAVNDPVADDYQAAVAEYYRQLSRE